MRSNRVLRCSRTKYVRCATRSLVLPHLLGPESRAFETFIVIWLVQKHDFDDEVTSLSFSRRRIWGSTVNSIAHVPTNVRCATRSLVSPHLLGPASRAFEPSLELGTLQSALR